MHESNRLSVAHDAPTEATERTEAMQTPSAPAEGRDEGENELFREWEGGFR